MKQQSNYIKDYQIDEIKKLLITVLKRHEVKRAGLFGFIVRGETTEDSDIDLLIEYKGKKIYNIHCPQPCS